jgi:hypothetical protein
MIKIAHRGNVMGPIPVLENRPDYLIDAIAQGYDVEVDVWWDNNAIWFGHSEPQYIVSPEDFYKIRDKAWFHCKNFNALHHFMEFQTTARYFWHQEDDFTLTSNGYIWTYPGMATGSKSIKVDLKLDNHELMYTPAGICTDYPYLIQ